MMTSKPWAAKGVALYPPSFCMVGQNQVFNALHQFRRSFWDGSSNDIAGFFVVFGDWGLGKTRLGYELIAEATGRVDEWLLNPNEYVIPPYHQHDSKARVLEAALQDSVLPLYIRYSSVCDEDLDASTWVARLAIEGLHHALNAPATAGGPPDLYTDLRNALHAKGVNLTSVGNIVRDARRNYDERLVEATDALRNTGITHLWIVVDEVETPGDLSRGLREETPTRIDDEYLLMVSEVIKHENWRARHPEVNFLLLCSVGMRDQIHIGPNLRRASSVTLEPNQLTDVLHYVESLPDQQAVKYPIGTVEGAFLATNRNFGWLNVLMASVHETYIRHVERSEPVEAWQLLRDFAKTDARAKHIFDDAAVLPLIGNIAGVPRSEVERLVYGQLPIRVGGTIPGVLTDQMAEALLRHEMAGRGSAFAELVQIHIDERGLANELTKPECGFKAKEGKADTYFTPNCEVSVVGLLEALRAFSVTTRGTGGKTEDFIIYADLEQWGQQLAALYPREGIEFAAEALHRIFTKPEYRVDGARHVGMSFRLWREFNKLLVAATEAVRFFKDGKYEPALEQYVRDVSQTNQRRAAAICLGLAKLLDESLIDGGITQAAGLKGIPHKSFTSSFVSPSVDGLRVTPDGRCTVVYCLDAQQTIDGLRAFIGMERVHPILLLLPATADVATIDQQIDASPDLRRCVITRRLVMQEEDFLLKYSGRGIIFDPQVARLSKIANGLLKSYQDEWQSKAREWANGLRKSGYLLAPIWSRNRGVNVADFAKGYRHMLANGCSLDAVHEDHGGPLNSVEFENCRQAAKKNIETPATWKYGDLLDVLTTDGSLMPRVPRCFFALLQELRTRSAESKLANGLFFAVPDAEIKALQQLEQILELLIGIGVVEKTGDLYKAVDQTLLESRRQSASTWLEGECKELIKDTSNLFPTQANILLNATYPQAKAKLTQAEAHIKSIDFGILSADLGSLADNSFNTFVKEILEVDILIVSVCPLDIGGRSRQLFDCSPARVVSYESRYSALSLWERVSFLGWLKKSLLATRDDMLQEIEELLQEAGQLEVAEGEPFPIAPVTLPLKAIKSELENAIKGSPTGSRTRMATIPVGSYTLLIDQYLVDSKYESAWKRLEALGDLVTRDRQGSFFAKFKKLHAQWSTSVKDFKNAEAAWQQVSAFTSDAPADVAQQLNTLKGELQQFAGLVRGGVKQQIQSQCDDVPEAELLHLLETEVAAASMQLRNLTPAIDSKHQELLEQLRNVIRQSELRALNRVLKVNHKPDKTEPSPAETYGKTKQRYEAFNGEVLSEGQSYFEKAGKTTHFSLWVDIYAGLDAGTYDEDQHPDHAEAIRELKAMKLLRSRLELR